MSPCDDGVRCVRNTGEEGRSITGKNENIRLHVLFDFKTFVLNSGNNKKAGFVLIKIPPGVPKKTGHSLISCNVKAIEAIAMK
jgi:hypothetical protein